MTPATKVVHSDSDILGGTPVFIGTRVASQRDARSSRASDPTGRIGLLEGLGEEMPSLRNCSGVTRRDSLQLGLGALLGGGFVSALKAVETLHKPSVAAKAKACILIWQDGGPTHYEMFDPKPKAPSEYRGEFKAIPTAVPGFHFSEHMTQLAKQLGRFAVVRSIRHDQGNHGAGNHYMMTGAPPRIPVGCGAFVSFHPSLGSVAAYERGTTGGLPPYFSMPSMSRSGGPNFLGAKYAPFVMSDNPSSSDFRVRDVALPRGIKDDRFSGRRDLRSRVDRLRRITEKAAGDPANALDEYYEQGYNII